MNNNPHCKCTPEKFPFDCERHCMKKGKRHFEHCQHMTQSGKKYWDSWEQGKGLSQGCTPDDPQLNQLQNAQTPIRRDSRQNRNQNRKKSLRKKISWAYAVTSVKSRLESLLPATLESLKNAGFGDPTIFIDGITHAESVEAEKNFNLPIVNRSPKALTYANWFLTLTELYFRNPHANRYAIFQDDFTTYKHLRQYLETIEYPKQGYWNLYSFPSNELKAPENKVGFHESNQLGRGAVALVFDNETVRTLLKQSHMIEKPRAATKPTKSVDGAVIQSLKQIGFKEYVHSPSLTQHRGIDSSMGNNKHPLSNSYRGDDFNAMDLLPKTEKSKGLGDHIESALSSVGITSERVSNWLGRPCNCAERKQKLNQLGNWASRIMSGKKQQAKEHLESIVGEKFEINKKDEPKPKPEKTIYECDVVIPYCQNNLPWLKAAIESVLNQSGAMCVVHLISDGFTVEDDPAKEFSEHPQVRLYRNEKSIGPYRTLNRIFNRLETDYIAVQDSDDMAMPHRIAHSIEMIEKNGGDIYGGAMRQFVSHENRDEVSLERLESHPVHYSGHKKWRLCPDGNVINGTLVVRKISYQSMNGFADLIGSADLEFATRAHRSGRIVVTDNEIVGLRRLHNKSLSHGPIHGVDTESRNNAHAIIDMAYEKMIPGCDFNQFGSLSAERKNSHLTSPVSRLIKMENLELHVSHACNLACKQCTHFSNFNHKGMISPEDANKEMELWSKRLLPKYFSLLGGEPTLNPELIQILSLARKHFPHSVIQLVTNGFNLKRHPELPIYLEKLNIRLEISDHHESEEYQTGIAPTRRLVEEWEKEYSIFVNWRKSSSRWRRSYLGDGAEMEPYNDGEPEKSWKACTSKWCPQMFQGKLWKCPQIAYLGMQSKNIKNDKWEKYLKYKPLDSNCTDDELESFVNRKAESCCGMCPANPESFMLPSPLRVAK